MRRFKCLKSKKKEKTDEKEVHGDVDEAPDKTSPTTGLKLLMRCRLVPERFPAT